jgi:hypothetical protein
MGRQTIAILRLMETKRTYIFRLTGRNRICILGLMVTKTKYIVGLMG